MYTHAPHYMYTNMHHAMYAELAAQRSGRLVLLAPLDVGHYETIVAASAARAAALALAPAATAAAPDIAGRSRVFRHQSVSQLVLSQ